MSKQQRPQTRHSSLFRSVRTPPTFRECSIHGTRISPDLRLKTETPQRIDVFPVCYAVEIQRRYSIRFIINFYIHVPMAIFLLPFFGFFFRFATFPFFLFVLGIFCLFLFVCFILGVFFWGGGDGLLFILYFISSHRKFT